MVDQSSMAQGVGRSIQMRPSREQARQVEDLKARVEALEKRLAQSEKAAKKAKDTD